MLAALDRYVLVDGYGRSYFEGRIFMRQEALAEAHKIDAESRPNGVWLVWVDGDEEGEQLLAL